MNDDRLERYLLGELPEDERDAFEREYFRDDEAFLRLQAAEDDLVDASVSGALAPAAAARLRERLRRSPAGRARLELARALRAIPRTASPAAPRAARPWLSLAAALALGLGASLVTLRSVHRELLATRDGREAAARQAADLAEELERTRRPGTEAAALVVAPGAERDGAGLATMSLPDGVEWIRLQLRLPEDAPPPPYTASLESPDGETLGLLRGLQPRDGGVAVTWPRLPRGTYVVILRTREPLESYTFRVD